MIDWAAEQYGGDPVYVVGLAEDGVTGYYASANNPNVRAISLHHLLEFGDIENVAWVNPVWLRRLQGAGHRRAREDRARGSRSTPRSRCRGRRSSAPRRIRRRTRSTGEDPLRIKRYNVHLARDLFRKRTPPVSFEDCRTPTQLITSEQNGIWPPSINDRTFARLGVREGARPARGLGPVGGLA